VRSSAAWTQSRLMRGGWLAICRPCDGKARKERVGAYRKGLTMRAVGRLCGMLAAGVMCITAGCSSHHYDRHEERVYVPAGYYEPYYYGYFGPHYDGHWYRYHDRDDWRERREMVLRREAHVRHEFAERRALEDRAVHAGHIERGEHFDGGHVEHDAGHDGRH
jgi:hypothetical protein